MKTWKFEINSKEYRIGACKIHTALADLGRIIEHSYKNDGTRIKRNDSLTIYFLGWEK